ncbi:MAG: HAMP domain-containing protein, partial [Phycisphaerae bacterium]|nr:HAMP domain-containing protein [Candidatus Saccharibacteria bacterium]NIR51286.1 HAMP domain-containing protein [candidate division KSB1 bacterium]NIV01468.1 HAMP domain-containing protein [Phycisphaerae bacterium]NIS26751.1 HAMP domain-containing protein [candidate division KSB1 bacterium]NIT71382.1 HAMP domain-containing protein [candidate division KSB1 bacterium]
WLGVDRGYFLQPVMVFAAQQLFLLVALFAALWWIFYIIRSRYIFAPLRGLERSLRQVGAEEIKDEGQNKNKKSPQELGELLESFNDIAGRIQS